MVTLVLALVCMMCFAALCDALGALLRYTFRRSLKGDPNRGILPHKHVEVMLSRCWVSYKCNFPRSLFSDPHVGD